MRRAPARHSKWGDHEGAIRVVAVVALAWGAAYLIWRLGWSGRGTPIVLFVTLVAAELFGWVSLAFYTFLAWRVPETVRPPVPEHLPSIDVFVCTYDEGISVVEPTLIGCRAIGLPHTTYLLDDGRRPEMAELATRLGAFYITRPDNLHAKAGNINHALGATNGEVILFLDADHVPAPDILDATIGYFTTPDVALVQTPHDFYNRDSAQHTQTARHEQSLFYEVIAPGKDRHDAMFWCGSATLVRRTALEGVGGVLTDTVAEDFHTTIAMHAAGWHTRYHNEVLVQGLAPHDLAAFLLQRARWARGNLAVFRTPQNPLTCPGLSPRQRVSYLASLANYFSGLQRLVLLLVLTWTLATGRLPMHASLITLLVMWLPWSILALVATNALGRGALGALDSTRYGLMTMGIYIRGILALFGAQGTKFQVTPKEGVDEGGLPVLRMLGLVTAMGIVVLAAWTARMLSSVGVISLPGMPALAAAITLLLGVWELCCIGAVLGKLARRRQLRRQYRFPVQLQARIARTSTIVPVLDITPSGLSFSSPVAIDPGARLELLSRIPDATGDLQEVVLPSVVQSCRRVFDDPHYRVGCRLVLDDEATYERLVEFCFVVQPELFGGRRVARPERYDVFVPKRLHA